MPLSKAARHWSESVDAVGGISAAEGNKLDPERYQAALREVARRALAERSADVVVVPTLMLRMGRISGRRLRWDSVIREVPIDEGQTNIGGAAMYGEAAGTSLRIIVFDGRPERVFERIVGLEPINEFTVTKSYRQGSLWKIDVRKDLFRDDALLRRGVVLAFDPWIPAPTLN